MFSCHRRSPSQDSPSSSGVVDIDNESSASSGDDAIEQRRRKENKAKDEKKAKTKRRRKNPAQDNEEVASVVDLTAARSKEQAAAACRDTIKRCNLFRRPEASAVRSWAKGKKVLLAVDLQVEQLSSIGTDQSHKHMRKHHAIAHTTGLSDQGFFSAFAIATVPLFETEFRNADGSGSSGDTKPCLPEGFDETQYVQVSAVVVLLVCFCVGSSTHRLHTIHVPSTYHPRAVHIPSTCRPCVVYRVSCRVSTCTVPLPSMATRPRCSGRKRRSGVQGLRIQRQPVVQDKAEPVRRTPGTGNTRAIVVEDHPGHTVCLPGHFEALHNSNTGHAHERH